jgi:outer membrane protein assembly factor BamB
MTFQKIGWTLAVWVGITAAVCAEAPPATDLSTYRKILTDAGLKTDPGALLDFFRARTLNAEQLARLEKWARQLGSDSFREREEASARLGEAGRHAVPFLEAVLAGSDLEARRRARACLGRIEQKSESPQLVAAAHLLAEGKPPEAGPVLLAYIPFAEDPLVERAVWEALRATSIRDEKADPALAAAFKDRLPARRVAAARVLGGLDTYREPMRALLTDREPRVRWAAAEGLILARDKTAFPALLNLLKAGPRDLAWEAEGLLFRIADDKGPAVSLGTGSDEERAAAHKAWTEWWEAHRDEVDLARIDRAGRKVGLRLVIALNGYGTQGRIWEIGPDRKTRWHLDEVGGPFDAEVLPTGRLLIAEYNSQRVTERDRAGKIHWQYRTPNGPLCVHRLPNGNTFLATNYEILEVTPAGKEVFRFSHRGGNLFWAGKMRDGHIYYGTYDGWMVELDRTGKELRKFPITRPDQGLVNVEVLPTGRFLIPQTRQNKVVELDPRTGKEVWSVEVPRPTCVARLPGGNLFVGSHNSNSIMEVDRTGKVLWREVVKGQVFGVRCR